MRRQKTYSAASGYVYQYFYEGHRQSGPDTEFVFDVSWDRKTSYPVSVVLSEAAVDAWQSAHGRGLNGTERYAVAKMALFGAFDERERPEQMREPIRVEEEGLGGILAALDID